jgi:hypothetical protein
MVKTLENLSNTINTLKSLASLLEKIGNMVIADEIGEKVFLSVNAIKQAYGHMRNGEIKQAFVSSRTAFVSSGK